MMMMIIIIIIIITMMFLERMTLADGSLLLHWSLFLPVIMPNLFSNLLKTLSLIENVKVFPTLTLLVISGS